MEQSGNYKTDYTPKIQEFQVDHVKLHKANRDRVIKRFKAEYNVSNGVLFLKGGVSATRYDTDRDELFRQESNFNYLFGVEEADCMAIIDLATEKTILLFPNLPEEYAVWLGEIRPLDFFRKKYHADEAFFTEDAEKIIKQINPECVYTIKSIPNLPEFIKTLKTDDEKFKYVLSECRLLKSEEEIKLLKHVAKVSSYAHNEVMKSCKPGMQQYELEALFLHVSYCNGRCRHTAYVCICATGKHAATLHYPENDKTMKDGQIALMDMGSEYHCYCSDITCSFPVNGKFTEDQKVIYEIVLASQLAVMEQMKPGVKWEDMHRLAERVICEGLLKHGFLKGSLNELIEAKIPALFFPHGLGHMLGLDVHDVGGYPPGVTKINEPGIKNLRARRDLEAGMYITVEPGLYFIDALLLPALKNPEVSKFLNAEKIEKFLNFGGVRIEDDVLVTATGIENFTLCPRTVADIEHLMQTKDSSKWDAQILN